MHRRACTKKASSPSFRLIELTMGLPWTHLSPASITDHFDESIMKGTRAMSGSPAMRLKNLAMAAGLDELAKLGRPGHVGALTHVDEQAFRIDVERFEAAQAAGGRDARYLARRNAGDCPNHGANMIRRRAAAAAQHIEEPAGGELPKDGRGVLRAFVVFAERIRQARVRVRDHEGVADARQFLDVRAQLFSAERAIESDDGGPRVANGIPEGLGGLARQRPPRCVADRTPNDDGQIRSHIVKHR